MVTVVSTFYVVKDWKGLPPTTTNKGSVGAAINGKGARMKRYDRRRTSRLLEGVSEGIFYTTINCVLCYIHRSIKLNNNIITFVYLVSIVVMMLFAMYHISWGIVYHNCLTFANFCIKSLVKDIALLIPTNTNNMCRIELTV